VLINDRNEVLAENINVDRADHIDWYSKRIDNPSVDTSLYIILVGTKGRSYSFINFEKEFTRWFKTKFIPALAKGNEAQLATLCFPEVTYWTERRGWTSLPADKFLVKFKHVLSRERFQETALKEITIGDEGLNQFIFNKPVYRKYYNACGEHNRQRYPVFNVILSYYTKRGKRLPESPPRRNRTLAEFQRPFELDYQEHFEFLKTEDGYKLLLMSLKR
jgi:hypothetical protein